jgi:phospholipase C
MNNTEPNIKNVFVLMLENHSFDNIFAMSGIQGINTATVQDWISSAFVFAGSICTAEFGVRSIGNSHFGRTTRTGPCEWA